MKLLYITNGITGAGGLERVLSVKASLLADQYGYQVHILGLNEEGQQPFFDFSPKIIRHSIAVGGNPLQYIRKYREGIQQKVKDIKPDVISVCDDGLKGFFIPSFLKTLAKIIYERHVSKLIEEGGNLGILHQLIKHIKWQLMEFQAKKFDRFIVLTEGNVNEWPSLKNLQVIPNPLSFYPEESSPLDQRTVICVGKISYQKGQDLLIQAWKHIFPDFPDWKLELYGKADDNFLKTESLKGKNIFWFPPAKNIKEKYLKSSVYVMSSRFEGFGMVLTEAMACGVPCVSFNCNYGPSDIIADGIDGFLAENGSVEDLTAKLKQMMESENLRKRMGVAAKERARCYLAGNIVTKWDMLFMDLNALGRL